MPLVSQSRKSPIAWLSYGGGMPAMIPRRLRQQRRSSLLPAVGLLWALLVLTLRASVWGFVPAPGAHVSASGARGTGAAVRSAMLLPAASPLFAHGLPATADSGEWDSIASALVAYGHYASLLVLLGCVVAERLLIKANMSQEEEQGFLIADSTIGVMSLVLVYTGYLRVTQYGKGWDFYQHEPIFWLKMTLLAVSGAASFFVTATVVKRAVAINQAGDYSAVPPVTQKLADRMASILNAELLAFLTIPLTATLMARGVGYADWFPWQAGVASASLVLFGLGYKYIKEAVEWTDDDKVVPSGAVVMK